MSASMNNSERKKVSLISLKRPSLNDNLETKLLHIFLET